MSRGKILIVDDEADVLKVLQLVLTRNGYEAVTAGSGMEGLVKAQGEGPDLILLDIMMQEMDGWEVLKLLQLDPQTRPIPVVMLSARTQPRDKIRGLQEGAVDYVTKPFVVKDILERIEAIMSSGREVKRS